MGAGEEYNGFGQRDLVEYRLSFFKLGYNGHRTAPILVGLFMNMSPIYILEPDIMNDESGFQASLSSFRPHSFHTLQASIFQRINPIGLTIVDTSSHIVTSCRLYQRQPRELSPPDTPHIQLNDDLQPFIFSSSRSTPIPISTHQQ